MVRTQRFLTLAGLAVLTASACTTPATNAGETFAMGGVAMAGEQPVADVSVVIRPPLAPEEVDNPRHTELAALGLACIDERPPPRCRSSRHAGTTDGDGKFLVSVGVGEAVTLGEGVSTPTALIGLALRVPAGARELTGPSVAWLIDLPHPPADVDVGPAAIWAPVVELVTTEGGDAVFRWEGDPPVRGARFVVLVEGSDGALVWREATSERELVLERSDLTGTRGAVSVVAVGGDHAARWRSARLAYEADEVGVRRVDPADVGWPVERDLAPGLVLTAIVSLLFANMLLVVTAGLRHRRRLTLGVTPSR